MLFKGLINPAGGKRSSSGTECVECAGDKLLDKLRWSADGLPIVLLMFSNTRSPGPPDTNRPSGDRRGCSEAGVLFGASG